jgi:hypothetical protein
MKALITDIDERMITPEQTVGLIRERLDKGLGVEAAFSVTGLWRLRKWYGLRSVRASRRILYAEDGVQQFLAAKNPLETIVLCHCAERINDRIEISNVESTAHREAGLRVKCRAKHVGHFFRYLKSIPGARSVRVISKTMPAPCDQCPFLHDKDPLGSRSRVLA